VNELWGPEIWRFALVLAVSLMVGWATDMTAACLAVGILLFLGRHVYMLHRYESWLRAGDLSEPPISEGIWGELYYHVYQIRGLARKRERKITEVLGRFQTSASALPDAVVVLAGDATIEWMNEAATRWLGLRAPADLGQRIDNLVRAPNFIRFLNAQTCQSPDGSNSSRNSTLSCPFQFFPTSPSV